MLNHLPYAIRLLTSAVKVRLLRLRGMRIGRRVMIGRRVRFGLPPGDVSIGDGVVLGDGVRFEGLRSVTLGDYVKIHENVRISGEDREARFAAGHNAWIGEESLVDCKRDVHIGRDVGIGCRSQIWTHGYFPSIADGNPYSFGEVTIEDGAWLPPACLVLPGVVVGEHAIIGTGSTLTKSIPPRVFASGVPCRVLHDDESRFREALSPEKKIEMVLERCLETLRARGTSVESTGERLWLCRFANRSFQLGYRERLEEPLPEKSCFFSWEHPEPLPPMPGSTTLFVLSDNRYTKRGSFHEWLVIRALLDRCTLRVTPLD